jgi:hypothetical protein
VFAAVPQAGPSGDGHRREVSIDGAMPKLI